MKTLLIWELVPDELKFFAIPDVSTEDIELLKKINGSWGNGEDDETQNILNTVSEYLSKDFYPTEDQPEPPTHQGEWSQYEIQAENLNDHKYDAVYQSGWFL